MLVRNGAKYVKKEIKFFVNLRMFIFVKTNLFDLFMVLCVELSE